MLKYYFSFGTDERYPFQGGWVEIQAQNLRSAIDTFKRHYPNRTPGLLNCADYYTQTEFNEMDWKENGNHGAFCHAKHTNRTFLTSL